MSRGPRRGFQQLENVTRAAARFPEAGKCHAGCGKVSSSWKGSVAPFYSFPPSGTFPFKRGRRNLLDPSFSLSSPSPFEGEGAGGWSQHGGILIGLWDCYVKRISRSPIQIHAQGEFQISGIQIGNRIIRFFQRSQIHVNRSLIIWRKYGWIIDRLIRTSSQRACRRIDLTNDIESRARRNDATIQTLE